MSTLAPIILFVFARPEHTRRTLEALAANDLAKQSDLIIYSDAARNSAEFDRVNAVRALVHNVSGFLSVKVIERETNYGLARNIIEGVTEVCNRYCRVIVVEDDLVTSPYFLQFMNDGLEIYRDDITVASIHGYVYPLININHLPETFFIRGADCWGWATWQRAWKEFEADGQKLLNELQEKNLCKKFDQYFSSSLVNMLKGQISGKNNSWAIRWIASTYLKNMYTLYPKYSLINNIGYDGTGTHCGKNSNYNVVLHKERIIIERQKIFESEISLNEFKRYYKSIATNIFQKFSSKLKRIFLD